MVGRLKHLLVILSCLFLVACTQSDPASRLPKSQNTGPSDFLLYGYLDQSPASTSLYSKSLYSINAIDVKNPQFGGVNPLTGIAMNIGGELYHLASFQAGDVRYNDFRIENYRTTQSVIANAGALYRVNLRNTLYPTLLRVSTEQAYRQPVKGTVTVSGAGRGYQPIHSAYGAGNFSSVQVRTAYQDDKHCEIATPQGSYSEQSAATILLNCGNYQNGITVIVTGLQTGQSLGLRDVNSNLTEFVTAENPSVRVFSGLAENSAFKLRIENKSPASMQCSILNASGKYNSAVKQLVNISCNPPNSGLSVAVDGLLPTETVQLSTTIKSACDAVVPANDFLQSGNSRLLYQLHNSSGSSCQWRMIRLDMSEQDAPVQVLADGFGGSSLRNVILPLHNTQTAALSGWLGQDQAGVLRIYDTEFSTSGAAVGNATPLDTAYQFWFLTDDQDIILRGGQSLYRFDRIANQLQLIYAPQVGESLDIRDLTLNSSQQRMPRPGFSYMEQCAWNNFATDGQNLYFVVHNSTASSIYAYQLANKTATASNWLSDTNRIISLSTTQNKLIKATGEQVLSQFHSHGDGYDYYRNRVTRLDLVDKGSRQTQNLLDSSSPVESQAGASEIGCVVSSNSHVFVTRSETLNALSKQMHENDFYVYDRNVFVFNEGGAEISGQSGKWQRIVGKTASGNYYPSRYDFPLTRIILHQKEDKLSDLGLLQSYDERGALVTTLGNFAQGSIGRFGYYVTPFVQYGHDYGLFTAADSGGAQNIFYYDADRGGSLKQLTMNSKADQVPVSQLYY